tara:strand:- start:916 stop:1110 length:195 start_codon:yes stop_codon:yes gene_type:complete
MIIKVKYKRMSFIKATKKEYTQITRVPDYKLFDVNNLLEFVNKFDEWKSTNCTYNDEIISIVNV